MNALVVNPETLRKLREVHEIQGRDANWQANPYMRGLYNGLELAMAILEERDPKYKEGFDVPPASLL